MNHARSLIFSLTVTVLLLAAATTARAQDPGAVPTAKDVLSTFDVTHPGRGSDYFTEKPTDHAMAYGLYASAAALTKDISASIVAADWLVDNAHPTPGATGWGLPFAWDAFSDGSTNPVSTVYGITVAICIAGLLDTFELTKDERYAAMARAALDYYRPFFQETEHGGYFWYSDQPSDAIETLNVSAMLSGQYARAGALFERQDFIDVAAKGATYIWQRRLHSRFGDYWPYSTTQQKPNDDAHAAYIVQGLLDYQRATDTAEFDLAEAIRYLGAFTGPGGVTRFVPHEDDLSPEARKMPALLWGVGMLVYTLAEAGDLEAAKRTAEHIHLYRHENGYSALPGQKNTYPRFTGHLALGLARLEGPDATAN